MGHFAKVVDSKVVQVIVAEPEFFNTFVDSSPGTWLETSYNTVGNKHLKGKTPLRGNFAGIGYTYDTEKDVFYAPQPFPSWTLNSDYLWEAPIAMPNDGKKYYWDESIKSWNVSV
tara:strand:- start:50 stop:394 length:345 start_codon:yes stop_codon:yes gene_type:complete